MEKKSSFRFSFGLIVVVFAVIVFIYLFINGSTFKTQSQTSYAELQRIEVSYPATGFVSKVEKIYTAPVDGKIKRIIDAGELVKKDTEVAQIIQDNGNVISIKSDIGGLVTYIIDNCEEKYKAENIDNLLVEEILNPQIKQQRRGGGENVKTGDFIFKIVGNDFVKYILIIDKELAEKIKQNDTLVFGVEQPVNMLIEGKIEKIETRENNKYLVVFSTSSYIELLLNSRKVIGRFIFGTYTASYVPETALTKNENGEDIVFIKDSTGSPKPIKVNVIGKNNSLKSYIVQGLSNFQEIYIDASSIENNDLK